MADTVSSTGPTSARPEGERLPASAHRMAAAVFIAMCATGALITWLVYSSEMSNRQSRLDRELFQAARLIETRVEQHVAFLTATRAFLATRNVPPDRAAFSTFVRGLDLRDEYAGLQGIGLSLVIAPAEEPDISAVLEVNYGLERSVWPEAIEGIRTSIILLEPADTRNLAAIGYDMATEERRRAAMKRAMRTGEPTATEPLILVQEITEVQQTGILVYLPFALADGEMKGFVYSPMRMGDLFQAALANHDLPIEIQAYDNGRPDVPLYMTPGFRAAVDARRPTDELTRSIAARDWTFTAVASESRVAAWPRFTILTAVAFALLSVASGVAAQSQRLALRRARALDAEVERRTQQKDSLIREMSHRIKNSISRAISIVRQSSGAATTKEEFVESVTIRLRAMAAAQDLLVASGNDRADLADLFTSELQQLYGGKVRPHVMQGPRVSLDAQQTLALGLAIHELATNSLKYGAAASPDGELKLNWTVAKNETGRELTIFWDEFVPEGALIRPAIAPTRTGFGTKLIETAVRTELGGSVARHSHAEGATVEIRIPLP